MDFDSGSGRDHLDRYHHHQYHPVQEEVWGRRAEVRTGREGKEERGRGVGGGGAGQVEGRDRGRRREKRNTFEGKRWQDGRKMRIGEGRK